jgi:hypothetical protein
VSGRYPLRSLRPLINVAADQKKVPYHFSADETWHYRAAVAGCCKTVMVTETVNDADAYN